MKYPNWVLQVPKQYVFFKNKKIMEIYTTVISKWVAVISSTIMKHCKIAQHILNS